MHVAGWSVQEIQDAFREFDRLVEKHDWITSKISQTGDVTRLFDKFGFPTEHDHFSLTERGFTRREGLEKFLREVDGNLAESFVQGVTLLARSRRLVLFVDTWETLEFSLDVDEWLSTKLLRNLPVWHNGGFIWT